MKRIMILCVLLAAGVVYAAVTQTHSTVTKIGYGQHEAFGSVTVAFDATGNQIETLGALQGYYDSISIATTGTDTSFKVYVLDEAGATVFSKVDCTTASTPYRYALSESDTGGTEHRGVSTTGACQIQLADASALTTLTVTLYYREWVK